MPLWIALLIFFVCGVAFYERFHKIPVRIIPDAPGVIVAPADGKVLQIFSLGDQKAVEIKKRFFGKIQTLCEDVADAATVVSIFMSPFDFHANWSPVNGKVMYVRHARGGYAPANTLKSFSNEKNEILIQSEGYQVKVIQIAGFLARRIECWVKEEDSLFRGQLLGMIRLGSQVSLILPGKVSVEVKVGQKVKGGETILGVVKSKA